MSADERRGFLGRLFNYAHNATTIVGIVFTTVSAVSIIIFLISEMAGGLRNPYIGIFAYIVLPAVFLLGLVLQPIGMWFRRRKLIAQGLSLEERSKYPKLDFNDPHLRRLATIILMLTVINAIIFGSSSYYAVHELETVEFCGTACHQLMQPEYTAYQQSPHSRVACVQCHIGPGASWFVRAKIDGLRQVWKTALDTYDRPIATPLLNLRPARETCEQCHWPAKHYGDKVKVFARFAEDEKNTPSYNAMILKTGGGSLDMGRHGGIHWWHIYSDNRIRYVSENDDRENMVWVELTRPDGERRVYTRGDDLPPEPELERRARVMDCIDCHNRPTHLFQEPSKALDAELMGRPELVGLPFYKHQALEAIKGDYPTHDAGVAAVREAVLRYYRDQQPDVWRDRQSIVQTGAEVAAEVYGRSVFPEMDTNWETHPNHIGHEDSPGCWRCHDGSMETADGEHVIPIDCETCHVFVVEDSPTPPTDDQLVLGAGG